MVRNDERVLPQRDAVACPAERNAAKALEHRNELPPIKVGGFIDDACEPSAEAKPVDQETRNYVDHT